MQSHIYLAGSARNNHRARAPFAEQQIRRRIKVSFTVKTLHDIAVSAADFMMMIALGWMVLEMTQSTLSIGMVWATRSAPHRPAANWKFNPMPVTVLNGALIRHSWQGVWKSPPK